MDTMTLAVAGIAALAILLIAVGIARLGRGSGISPPGWSDTRPGVEPASKTDKPEGLGRACSPRAARWPASTGSSSSATSGPTWPASIARADLRLKSSEFLGDLGRSRSSASPAIFFVLGFVLPPLGSPIALLVGVAHRVHPAALLAGPAQERPPQRLQQAAAGHDHPRSPTPCGPARRSSRRSSSSSANRARRSRPSSPASSARSTSACRSTRRWRTWSAASAPTTSS